MAQCFEARTMWTHAFYFLALSRQFGLTINALHFSENLPKFEHRNQGRIAGARASLFLAKSVLFLYIVYNVWKNIFEIEFWFYSGRNPRSFWKCGGCLRARVCVCVIPWAYTTNQSFFYLISVGFEIVAATVFLFCKGPILRPFWSQKYMPDCRKSHLIFQNFLGKAPRPPAGARAFGARFGALPPYLAPFPKFLDPPMIAITIIMCCTGGRRGIYFAFRDQGACATLLAVHVFYVTCPSVVTSLAVLTETPTGPEITSIMERHGVCVANSVPSEAGRPSYLCQADGSWYYLAGRCHCSAGYELHNDSSRCVGTKLLLLLLLRAGRTWRFVSSALANFIPRTNFTFYITFRSFLTNTQTK